jgi:hypothetical protein
MIRDVLVGRVFGFDNGWERRHYSPRGHGAISKCTHSPQSRQSYHSDHYDETIPPARAREIIVTIMGAVGFASLGCLDIVIVAVIGRGEQQRRSLGARQKPIADHVGQAKLAGWLGRRGKGVVLPLLALANCSGSRGG